MVTSGLLLIIVLIGVAVANVLAATGSPARIRWSDLWRWDGTLDRGPYLLIGAIAFALKHNLDRGLARFVFHRPWTLFNYWIPPTRAIHITALPKEDAMFLTAMLAISLPFIWLGVVLTLRRLRSAGLPLWLVLAFFLPVINLAFFGILSIIPSKVHTPAESARGEGALSRVIPDHPAGSAAMALLITVPVGLAIAKLSVSALGNYGWGLFVALPFCLGITSALLYGYHRPRKLSGCLAVACLSVLLLGGALLALAIEGLICLAMALPIGLALALIGGSIGYAIQSRRWDAIEARPLMLLLALFTPALMAAEAVSALEPPLWVVRTAIEINATPDRVWRNLVSFPKLADPTEWAFRLGIAYPAEATLRGAGPGALRECLFSTGTFVEHIEAWEERRLLRFSIMSRPPVMRELTPYPEIHTPHLDGYLRPERAEFTLTALPGGGTRLEGTSWYSNRMWPAAYWQVWSDWILHRVHVRVFRHIKRMAEAGT